jgi:hypothetical protein
MHPFSGRSRLQDNPETRQHLDNTTAQFASE